MNIAKWMKTDIGRVQIARFKLQAFTALKFGLLLLVAHFYDWDMTALVIAQLGFLYIVLSTFGGHFELEIAYYEMCHAHAQDNKMKLSKQAD